MTSTAIPERTWDCIPERSRLSSVNPFLISEHTEDVWHIAPHRGRTVDWMPIRCSKDEGITLPGSLQRRVPTCPDCRALVGLDNGSDGADQ